MESQLLLAGAAVVEATASIRRKDLTGVGDVRQVKLNGAGSVSLFPGRWDVLVTPPAGYYVSRFASSRNNNDRPEGWNEILVTNFNRFTVTLANDAGSIHGVVKSGSALGGGAPVFLETWDPATRRRLIALRGVRADMKGNYRFDGLPPGEYRVLSTFEYLAPDAGMFDAAGAVAVRVDASGDRALDLELYGIP